MHIKRHRLPHQKINFTIGRQRRTAASASFIGVRLRRDFDQRNESSNKPDLAPTSPSVSGPPPRSVYASLSILLRKCSSRLSAARQPRQSSRRPFTKRPTGCFTTSCRDEFDARLQGRSRK